MSTRAYISVRVKDEDLGKEMKVDISKFGLTEEDMTPRRLGPWDSLTADPKLVAEKAQPVVLSDKYITVYHHSGGSPSCLGRTLYTKYNDYDKALNLLLGGDISCAVGSNFPIYYVTRDKWEGCKPEFRQSYPCPEGDREYAYVYEDGHWMMYAMDGDQDNLCNVI